MAAIFAADVVGYSKLMAVNEKLTLFRLKETRKITDKIIHELHGKIFSTAGDSIMAEFASPIDAMEAAISIQEQVSSKVKEINDNILIEFRIGINLGDIMVQDNNLYGDNVNIAARLESISTPGEITISEKVYQEVVDKVNIKFKYGGEKKLKNISKKIKVYTSISNASTETVPISKKFKVLYLALAFLFATIVAILLYYFMTNNSNNIEYTDNSRSVLENFRSNQTSSGNEQFVDDGKIVIALMAFQNQTSSIQASKIDDLSAMINNELSSKEIISVVNTPKGSENLNPPEVMLIATESNASFVINGIIYKEQGKDFLNLKIYEAKRGSLIVNQKISVADTNDLNNFIAKFAKDISKK